MKLQKIKQEDEIKDLVGSKSTVNRYLRKELGVKA